MGGHCLVRWPKATRPKKIGGLGILDLERFSQALRLRWPWQEWASPERPLAGTTAPCNSVDRAIFQTSTVVTVGKGDKALFWHSSWLDGQALIDIAPTYTPWLGGKIKQ